MPPHFCRSRRVGYSSVGSYNRHRFSYRHLGVLGFILYSQAFYISLITLTTCMPVAAIGDSYSLSSRTTLYGLENRVLMRHIKNSAAFVMPIYPAQRHHPQLRNLKIILRWQNMQQNKTTQIIRFPANDAILLY